MTVVTSRVGASLERCPTGTPMSNSDSDDGPTASQIQAQPMVAACAAGAPAAGAAVDLAGEVALTPLRFASAKGHEAVARLLFWTAAPPWTSPTGTAGRR